MIWPIWAILEFFKITCFGRAMVERQAGTICAFIKEFKMFLTFFSFKTIVTSFLYFYKQIYPTYSLTNFTLDQKISSLFYNYASKFVSKCSLSSRKIAKNWRIEFFSRNFSPSLGIGKSTWNLMINSERETNLTEKRYLQKLCQIIGILENI